MQEATNQSRQRSVVAKIVPHHRYCMLIRHGMYLKSQEQNVARDYQAQRAHSNSSGADKTRRMPFCVLAMQVILRWNTFSAVLHRSKSPRACGFSGQSTLGQCLGSELCFFIRTTVPFDLSQAGVTTLGFPESSESCVLTFASIF